MFYGIFDWSIEQDRTLHTLQGLFAQLPMRCLNMYKLACIGAQERDLFFSFFILVCIMSVQCEKV